MKNKFIISYLNLLQQSVWNDIKVKFINSGNNPEEVEFCLNRYRKLKENKLIDPVYSDIQKINDFGKLKEIIKSAQSKTTKKQKQNISHSEFIKRDLAQKIYDKFIDSLGYEMISVPTWEAAQYYGRIYKPLPAENPMKWCITTSNPKNFCGSYDNSCFYFLIKKDQAFKYDIDYKLSVEINIISKEVKIWDMSNSEQNFENYPEIKKYFEKTYALNTPDILYTNLHDPDLVQRLLEILNIFYHISNMFKTKYKNFQNICEYFFGEKTELKNTELFEKIEGISQADFNVMPCTVFPYLNQPDSEEKISRKFSFKSYIEKPFNVILFRNNQEIGYCLEYDEIPELSITGGICSIDGFYQFNLDELQEIINSRLLGYMPNQQNVLEIYL